MNDNDKGADVIDFASRAKKIRDKREKPRDADQLRIMTNEAMIEEWMAVLEHEMEESYRCPVGGRRIDATLNAIENILKAVLLNDRPTPPDLIA